MRVQFVHLAIMRRQDRASAPKFPMSTDILAAGRLVGAELSQNAILTFILLLANFPAALACIWIAGDEFSRVHLYIVNESTVVIEELSVTWPGGEQQVGDLAPSGRADLSFYVNGDGAVDFTAQQGGEVCAGTFIGYVTTNMGEAAEVAFLDGCAVEVKTR